MAQAVTEITMAAPNIICALVFDIQSSQFRCTQPPQIIPVNISRLRYIYQNFYTIGDPSIAEVSINMRQFVVLYFMYIRRRAQLESVALIDMSPIGIIGQRTKNTLKMLFRHW